MVMRFWRPTVVANSAASVHSVFQVVNVPRKISKATLRALGGAGGGWLGAGTSPGLGRGVEQRQQVSNASSLVSWQRGQVFMKRPEELKGEV